MFCFQNQGEIHTLITYSQYIFPKVLKVSCTCTRGDFGRLLRLIRTVLVIINVKISSELMNTNKRQVAFCPWFLRLIKPLVTS